MPKYWGESTGTRPVPVTAVLDHWLHLFLVIIYWAYTRPRSCKYDTIYEMFDCCRRAMSGVRLLRTISSAEASSSHGSNIPHSSSVGQWSIWSVAAPPCKQPLPSAFQMTDTHTLIYAGYSCCCLPSWIHVTARTSSTCSTLTPISVVYEYYEWLV